MPSLKIIRKRISSVKSTQKITRAMKMVAGARLSRAQQRIVAMRPYAIKTAEVLRRVAEEENNKNGHEGEAFHEVFHPLLAQRPEKKVVFVVLSSDRGLCGAFNTNITKTVEREWREKESAGAEIQFVTIGRKGREFVARRGGTVTKDFPIFAQGVDLAHARVVSAWLISQFEKADFDSIYVVYNEFKSAITQKVVFEPLLPFRSEAVGTKVDTEPTVEQNEFLYEPNRTALLERLVPMYVEITLLRALLESQASEFGARMTAMDAATRNAKEMIARLTLAYNRARQAAITKELMEIIGGAEALKE